MSNLDQEIADAEARVARLKEKKRAAEVKERSRFAEAVVAIIDEIENDHEVTVRELVDRARAKLDEQDAKRHAASKKAAAKRRAAAQVDRDAVETVPRDELNDEPENQSVWGGYGA